MEIGQARGEASGGSAEGWVEVAACMVGTAFLSMFDFIVTGSASGRL